MIKKLIYSFLLLVGIMLIAYIFQPLKKGVGFDAATSYELVKNWPPLPKGLKIGNPTGIGIDTSQNIVVFHRAGREWSFTSSMPTTPIGDKTILIIDKDNGRLISSWGDHFFLMPHGLAVDSENNIWVTDVGLHQVFKFTHDGKLLLTVGEAGKPSNDSMHFNKPTDIAIAQDGSFYVSDGYGNSRIVKFSPNGKYLLDWGKKGNQQNEFNIPHGLSLDNNGNVYVADRENNRVQVFDPNGKFLRQFTDKSFGAVCAVTFDQTQSKLFATDDLTFLQLKHRGSDIFVFDTTGKIQTRFGRSGSYTGNTAWYHDLAIDKEENIYVGDILENTIQKFRKVASK